MLFLHMCFLEKVKTFQVTYSSLDIIIPVEVSEATSGWKSIADMQMAVPIIQSTGLCSVLFHLYNIL